MENIYRRYAYIRKNQGENASAWTKSRIKITDQEEKHLNYRQIGNIFIIFSSLLLHPIQKEDNMEEDVIIR